MLLSIFKACSNIGHCLASLLYAMATTRQHWHYVLLF